MKKMMMKPLPVRIISAVKACRRCCGGGGNISSSKLTSMGMGMSMAPPPPPETELQKPPTTSPVCGNNNPCLDLFYNVFEQDTPEKADANRLYLKQLLPAAWSHNPLTTLKLICNLNDVWCAQPKFDAEGFYTAAFWLHHNHPKTLASNLLPIAGSFGGMDELVQLPYRILAGQDARRESSRQQSSDEVHWNFEEMIFQKANKVAVERYERDPDYRLLHDRASDIFAHCLKHDIQNLKKKRMQMDNDNIPDTNNIDNESSQCLELTLAAYWLDERATFLCESVARKVIPYAEEGAEVEADYAYKIRQRLRKEVLEPLRKASDGETVVTVPNESNKWGYDWKFEREACVAKQYLEELKAALSGGCESKIEAGALLPDQIIRYVNDEDVGHVAEVQWKAMLEDMIQKQGKGKGNKKNLNNSLAVCDVSLPRMRGGPMDVSVGLGLLVSELNEEPAWKGKVINFSRNPQLYSIPQGQGLDYDLKSKCEFVSRMDCPDREVDFQKVFYLILEVAVNRNLKPEQMINKVFVFTCYQDFDEDSALANRWESDYEAIQSKFKEKGYGDVVPGLVFWDVNCSMSTPVTCKKQGVASFSGYSNGLIKYFLDNDGEMGPEVVMEAAICAQPYQNLVVVD